MSAIQTSISCLKLTSHKRRLAARRQAYTTPQVNPVGLPLTNALLHRASSEQIPHLVLQAMNNDLLAQAQLFTKYRPQLYRSAYSILRNREDAEDAVQDCWLRTLSNLLSFRGRSSFSTWLTRIVIDSALMILRKKRNSREISFDAADDSVKVSEAWRVPTLSRGAEEILGKREEAAILERTIFALRPRVRQVAELVQLRGLTTTEAALALGISGTAAKARLFHARNALRKSICALIRQPFNLVKGHSESRTGTRTSSFKEVRR